MADVKISELSAASTPLAGTEVVAIVQSGATKKVAVSEIGASTLAGLSDVDLTGAATGNVLTKSSGGDWIPAVPSAGSSGPKVISFHKTSSAQSIAYLGTAALEFQSVRLNTTGVTGIDYWTTGDALAVLNGNYPWKFYNPKNSGFTKCRVKIRVDVGGFLTTYHSMYLKKDGADFDHAAFSDGTFGSVVRTNQTEWFPLAENSYIEQMFYTQAAGGITIAANVFTNCIEVEFM